MKNTGFVYLMQMPQSLPHTLSCSAIRLAEIEKTGNEHRKKELYFGWKLLETAMYDAYGIRPGTEEGARDENGAPLLSGAFCSVSHSKDLIAAVVCQEPVGIDVERISRGKTSRMIARRILTENEKKLSPSQEDEDASACWLIRCWTGKESLFKRTRGAYMDPLLFDTLQAGGVLKEYMVETGGERYCLCVASEGDVIIRLVFGEGGNIQDASPSVPEKIILFPEPGSWYN